MKESGHHQSMVLNSSDACYILLASRPITSCNVIRWSTFHCRRKERGGGGGGGGPGRSTRDGHLSGSCVISKTSRLHRISLTKAGSMSARLHGEEGGGKGGVAQDLEVIRRGHPYQVGHSAQQGSIQNSSTSPFWLPCIGEMLSLQGGGRGGGGGGGGRHLNLESGIIRRGHPDPGEPSAPQRCIPKEAPPCPFG